MAHDTLIALGSNSIDEYYEISSIPLHGEKALARFIGNKPGGMIANAASIYAGYGHPTVMFDFMNTNPANRILIEDLEHYHVRTDLIDIDERYPFTKCQVMIKDGERIIFVMVDNSVTLTLTPEQEAFLSQADYLYTTVTDFSKVRDYRRIFTEAKKKGLKIFFDIEATSILNLSDLEAILDFGDILSINEQAKAGLDAIYGNVIGHFRHKALVLVTMAERGSAIYAGDASILVDAFPVEPVDTTGAGDTYNTSFLHGLTRGWPLEQCGRFASAAASRSILALGPRTGVASETEVLTFMENFSRK